MISLIKNAEVAKGMSNRLPSIGHVQVFEKMLLEKSLLPGDVVIDATIGNGNDALLLLELVGKTGFLYGFDIQTQALENTRLKLKESEYDNFKLICASHAEMKQYVDQPVNGILFNLGYLPAGDKTCTTLWETTQTAIAQGMALIKPNGFVGVMTYPGHESGKEEDLAIEAYFSQIDQKQFQIAQIAFINQKKNPPKLYWLTKRT